MLSVALELAILARRPEDWLTILLSGGFGMDAAEIRRLKPKLLKYLKDYCDCFGRSDTRRHLQTYVEGQLSKLDRKSVEPMALAAGVAPRTLQQFLNSLEWDQEQLIDIVQWRVARQHTSDRSIGLIDETSCAKKGDKTPGVQRQWCGATGKQDNCVTTVHLGYAVDDFHCLLSSELFLPESWAQDRARCRAAKIPDEMEYRPKWQIALELLDRALANGVSFRYLTFDEGYGGKPEFLRQLAARGQTYVAEVPCSFTGWLQAPYVTHQPYRRHGRGRGRAVPRLGAGSTPAQSVEHHLLHTPALRDQAWKRWRIKDTQKGPMVWETKHVQLVPKGEDDLPAAPLHLIVARNVRDVAEVKFFLSNAPPEAAQAELLHVAFSRWRIERCFEDQKTELGFDHFEGRSYLGLKRHQAITAVTHLFLSEVHLQLRGEKPRVNGLPTANRDVGLDPVLGTRANRRPIDPRRRSRRDPLHPATKRHGSPMPHSNHTQETRRTRRSAKASAQVRVE
jgi:SRSO17 transposase